jgi:hypothetical protein
VQTKTALLIFKRKTRVGSKSERVKELCRKRRERFYIYITFFINVYIGRYIYTLKKTLIKKVSK